VVSPLPGRSRLSDARATAAMPRHCEVSAVGQDSMAAKLTREELRSGWNHREGIESRGAAADKGPKDEP